MFAIALMLSVAGLLVGPALAAWARGRAVAMAALDGATLGIIPALLLVRLLPHLVEEIGVLALLGLVGGYLGLLVIEARSHHHATELGFALVVPTLAVHSFLDGTALAIAFQRTTLPGSSAAMGAALVLHKVPEGLFLASGWTASVGPRTTVKRIAALGATTVIGALTGRELLAHAPDAALHVAVAVGLGVMLRMVVHRHDALSPSAAERAAGGLAFVICLAAVLAIPSPHHWFDEAQPDELSAARALVPLFLESAPWLLAVLVASRIARWRWPSTSDEHPARPSAWLAATVLTSILIGPWFSAARGLADPVLRRVAVPRVPASLAEQASDGRSPGGASSARPWSRLAEGVASIAPRAGLVLPSYVMGVALSVVAEAAVPREALGPLGWIAVPLGALVGVLLPIGPAGACVLSAIVIHKGAPLAAGLSFVLAGATVGGRMGSSRGGVAREPAARTWARTSALLVAVAASSALLGAAIPGPGAQELHSLGLHAHRRLEWIAAAALVAWTVSGIVRAGPRAWFDTAFGGSPQAA